MQDHNPSNPYDPSDPTNATRNEGVLAYLQMVDSQEYPPLVHSLSCGDIESQIFNSSQNGSVEYAQRCDQEFMQMGLRGLTIVVALVVEMMGLVCRLVVMLMLLLVKCMQNGLLLVLM